VETTLADIADFVWSYPVVGLCLLSAVFFTLRLGLIQVRAFPHAIALITGRYDRPDEKGVISHFQALSAALSGTIGIGNIGGVAIAIGVGGPGAVLWMWVIGLFGMATKYVECALGTHYRAEDPITGEVRGGPMHYITAGLGPRWRPISIWYAAAIALAGFGFSSMFQSNQAAAALSEHHDVPPWLTGALLFVLGGITIMGGIRRIGHVAARLVPAMCIIYVLGAFGICLAHLGEMPRVLQTIVVDGFTGEAAAGGAVGSVLAWGVRRAIFSNEAGLGSASIAHAAVRTDYPIREGIVASLGPLIDTIIVSGATASIIVLSGNYGAQMYQPDGDALALVGAAEDGEPSHTLAEGRDLSFTLPESGEPMRIGFSYRRVRGDAAAEWLDGTGRPIRRVELSLEPEPGEDTDPLGCEREGAWARCVLPPLEAGASAHLLRLSGGPSSDWEVGRVEPVSKLEGIALTTVSFERYIPGFGAYFIAFAGFLFAFSTMVTWSYYGETATAYLFGPRLVPVYRAAFVSAAFVGAVNQLGVVVSFSDIMVGLLVIPNTIAILAMSGRVAGWTREYFAALRAGEIRPSRQGRLHERAPAKGE
jgi:AGCS family alanine or glycine:cation symporter